MHVFVTIDRERTQMAEESGKKLKVFVKWSNASAPTQTDSKHSQDSSLDNKSTTTGTTSTTSTSSTSTSTASVPTIPAQIDATPITHTQTMTRSEEVAGKETWNEAHASSDGKSDGKLQVKSKATAKAAAEEKEKEKEKDREKERERRDPEVEKRELALLLDDIRTVAGDADQGSEQHIDFASPFDDVCLKHIRRILSTFEDYYLGMLRDHSIKLTRIQTDYAKRIEAARHVVVVLSCVRVCVCVRVLTVYLFRDRELQQMVASSHGSTLLPEPAKTVDKDTEKRESKDKTDKTEKTEKIEKMDGERARSGSGSQTTPSPSPSPMTTQMDSEMLTAGQLQKAMKQDISKAEDKFKRKSVCSALCCVLLLLYFCIRFCIHVTIQSCIGSIAIRLVHESTR